MSRDLLRGRVEDPSAVRAGGVGVGPGEHVGAEGGVSGVKIKVRARRGQERAELKGGLPGRGELVPPRGGFRVMRFGFKSIDSSLWCSLCI